jgi:8-oxo-dGTP pyrophosphatase MutT (NUDIX family)
LLSEEYIIQRLKAAYQPGLVTSNEYHTRSNEGADLKCAAVLIPLVRQRDEWNLVYTRRKETVEHHKGQVSFPGGGCEIGESSPETTALREAWEEIGLPPEDVHLLGRMNDVITITSYRVTPVVGTISWTFPVRLEPLEVGRLFTIPIVWLADRSNWHEEHFMVDGTQRPFPVVRYRPYDGEILWGITAHITITLLNVLELIK